MLGDTQINKKLNKSSVIALHLRENPRFIEIIGHSISKNDTYILANLTSINLYICELKCGAMIRVSDLIHSSDS